MWSLRVLSTLLVLATVCGIFSVALKLPDKDVLDPDEKTCSGDACPEDENSKSADNGESIPVQEFLEVTDHEPVSRQKNEKDAANTDRATVELASDGTKDIILNKLLKNAERQKPNKLQGPSLIARYVQGVRGELDADGKIKEERKVDEVKEGKEDLEMHRHINGVKEDKEDLEMHRHINFMSDFLDMDPISMKKEEADKGSDLSIEDTFENVTAETELENEGLTLNLTETQDIHLDFMADFLDEDHLDVQLSSENENNVSMNTDTDTIVTDIPDNQTSSIDVNVTEILVNDTTDSATGEEEKQIDLANLLEEDPLENVSEVESTESNVDSAEIDVENEEIEKSAGDDNQLDFVTDFLNSDPFDIMETPEATDEVVVDKEAIDRSDAVEINAEQEENLDFLTDFLSEDPAVVQAESNDELASENEIPQDILELYSEDEVVPERQEVYKRKKPISSNVEWIKEEPKEEASSFWSWFGF